MLSDEYTAFLRLKISIVMPMPGVSLRRQRKHLLKRVNIFFGAIVKFTIWRSKKNLKTEDSGKSFIIRQWRDLD